MTADAMNASPAAAVGANPPGGGISRLAWTHPHPLRLLRTRSHRPRIRALRLERLIPGQMVSTTINGYYAIVFEERLLSRRMLGQHTGN